MFRALKVFFKTSASIKRFSESATHQRRLVVYSEGSHDWPHLGPIIKNYLEKFPKESVSFLSSQENDPGLKFSHDRMHGYYIGMGTARTILFRSLDAKVLLLSLPDLENLELKKSSHPVKYVYAFHSINSSHIVYRDRAFEHYPNILTMGPHHDQELRKEEELRKIPKRNLIPCGSVKLDTIIADYRKHLLAPGEKPEQAILLAPSWGECSFAEDPPTIKTLIQEILNSEWKIYLRLHPMTVRRLPQLIPTICALFNKAIESGALKIETDLNDNSSLKNSAVMISDWSGAATEYAFALEKPVIFIDMPQKINNPRWKDFGLNGIEDSIRQKIGKVVRPMDLKQVPTLLNELTLSADMMKRQIKKAYQESIHNPGHAASSAADALYRLLD